jgi:hypothetical protein
VALAFVLLMLGLLIVALTGESPANHPAACAEGALAVYFAIALP